MRQDKQRGHSKLYDTRGWKTRRKHQLTREPLCEFCTKRGLTKVATVADHIVPHRGNADKFFNGKLQSLCASCHNSIKQRMEQGSYNPVGEDGLPLDLNNKFFLPPGTL